MPQKTALVAVEGASLSFDRLYSYRLEPGCEAAGPGMRVLVPFGRGNRGRQGVILGLSEETPCPGKKAKVLKPVLRLLDERPVLDGDRLDLARFVRERTFCTYYEAVRLLLPGGMSLRVGRRYAPAPGGREAAASLPEAEKTLFGALLAAEGPLSEEEIEQALPGGGGTEALRALLAKGIAVEENVVRRAAGEATEDLYRLAQPPEDASAPRKLTPRQRRVLDALEDLGSASMKELLYYSGVSRQVVMGLVKKELVARFERRVFRTPYAGRGRECETPVLSDGQQAAFETLRAKLFAPEGSASLLYGVTGSGKTLIFMKLIEEVVARGDGAILLVPEISLTPQMVDRFCSRFGDSVAVLHSGLSAGERLDEWDRVRSGAAQIVVGTRSAVFAPVQNLALVIIDEEQEASYKSEASPRYHARDVARFRCAKAGALLLLSSATPSVETFYAAQKGRYGLAVLPERYGGAPLPEVKLVDMKRELARGNVSPLSDFLTEEIRRNMSRGEQTILLINRRGYNTYVSCGDCGHVLTCPNCSVSLTYHHANGRLMCHTCGYSSELARVCPQCGSGHLRYSGTGTQKVEEELTRLLPGVRLLRMDTDTTLSKFSHEKILSQFEREHYDLLIGTQMVAKGLDFPNVTLVGVLNADQSLHSGDFRAAERTFSLLTQVVGRSGRGGAGGRAVIQTQTPEDPVLNLAARQDYEGFYRGELGLRELLLYPPFCDLCEIVFSGVSEPRAAQAAQAFGELLRKAREGAEEGLPLRLLGPVPAGMPRANGRYRYKIILKCRAGKRFFAFLSKLLEEYAKLAVSRSAPAFVDLNPMGIL